MAIPDKYKGKSFAEIAKEIQKQYKDRNDPISIRGLNKSMQELKASQDYQKAMMEQQEQMQKEQAAMQMQQQTQAVLQDNAVATGRANSPAFNPETEPSTTFNRQASSDYNGKFVYGGNINKFAFGDRMQNRGITPFDEVAGLQMPDTLGQVNVPTSEQFSAASNLPGSNTSRNQMIGGLAMQGVPLVGNLIQAFNTKAAAPMQARTVDTRALTSSINNFTPRESRFDKVDMNDVERGMNEASGRFTQNNINASNGNAGAFAANELANQNNLYKSIGSARMQAQQMDQQTDQLNAAEKARVDQMKYGQIRDAANINTQVSQFNAQSQSRNDIINEQNRGVAQSAKSDFLNTALQGVASIGTTLMGAGQLGEGTGYNILGNYLNNKKYGGKMNKYATGGTMGSDCGGPGQPPCAKSVDMSMDVSGGIKPSDIPAKYDPEGYLIPDKKQFYDGTEEVKVASISDYNKIDVDLDDTKLSTKEEFDKYYADKALSKIKEAYPEITNITDVDDIDKVAILGNLPDYDLYKKKRTASNSKTVSGKDVVRGNFNSGYNSDGVAPTKINKKAISKSRKTAIKQLKKLSK